MISDSSLLTALDITSGLKEGGWIIINSGRKAQDFGISSRFRVATVDASAIAFRHRLGGKTNPITNTAMLGAFARVTDLVSIEAVIEAIREMIAVKQEENIAAAKEGYGKT